MKRATEVTVARRRYLDLQRKAKRSGRPTDELIQLYALEGFLDRLAQSNSAEKFILKGGVLLAALDARRPTRDIDLAARALDNEAEQVLSATRQIARMKLDDGLEFDSDRASAEVIREADEYSGIRVTLGGSLSRAMIRMHVDINVGDPIWPEPRWVQLPRILHGVLTVRGYPIEMVLAEKIVTAIARGSANTRWRDFVDIYTLTLRHNIDGKTVRESIVRVAQHRAVTLESLRVVLAGYAEIAQQRWLAWLKRQRLASTIPNEFAVVLDSLITFADPAIDGKIADSTWDSAAQRWS